MDLCCVERSSSGKFGWYECDDAGLMISKVAKLNGFRCSEADNLVLFCHS